MKKLLLTAILSVFVLGNMFAQFNFATSTNIGQTLETVSTTQSKLTVNFNTAILNSTWSYPVATPTVLTVAYKKCQTQKGLQALAYPNSSTATAYGFGSSDCNSYTANRNPIHVASLDSLKKMMTKSLLASSLGAGGAGGNVNDTLSKPAACLFDVGAGNQAFGMYPGKCKRIEYAFYYNLIGKAAVTDLTFDIDTYDAGTTGKTASYELAVYYSTTGSAPALTDVNLLAPKVAGFYVTGSGKKTVNLAADLGLSASSLSNKRLIIFLRTLGTSNASDVVDGLRNEVDANKVPVVTDPIIVIDNLAVTYGTASWVVPAGAVASTVFNHNNGTPVNLGVGSTDYSGGTPVPVYENLNSDIKFYLTGAARLAALDITEGNNGGVHSSNFSFAASGAIKKRNPVDGTYSIPVTYNYTPSDGTTKFLLSIPAPTSGSVNDTLELTLTASNVTAGSSPTERLEITNGVRFWYNIGVDASIPAPVVTVSTTSLTGMDYSFGNGPSVERSFTVSGTNLSSSVTVTAPTNYEISTGTGGSFSALSSISIPQTDGTAAETTIYARLKAGLADNTYIENITIAATNVTTQNVSCNGVIVDPQNLTVQIGQNGSVSENSIDLTNGQVLVVNKGLTKTFTFTGNLGYEVATLTYNDVDVKSQISGGQYTAIVNGASTLAVTFKKIQYVLSLKDASTGTVNLICDYGTTPAFSFTANAGWVVSSILYNDVDVTSSLVNGIYTIPAITSNSLMNVTFSSTVSGAPQLISDNVKVFTTRSEIIIEGTSEGEIVSLYNVHGVQMQTLQSRGDRMAIPALKDAVYLVKTTNKVFKVIL